MVNRFKRLLRDRKARRWMLFGLIAFLIGLFLKVAEEILEIRSGDVELLAIDRYILVAVAKYRSPHLTDIAVSITALGSGFILGLWTVIAMIFVGLKQNFRRLFYLLSVSLGAAILSQILKATFTRVRPMVVPHLVEANGYSFPSGHSLGSSSVYLALAILIALDFPRTYQRAVIYTVSTGLVVAIGFSRIYLGVHFPSDVLGGLSFGTSLALIFAVLILMLKPFSPRRDKT